MLYDQITRVGLDELDGWISSCSGFSGLAIITYQGAGNEPKSKKEEINKSVS